MILSFVNEDVPNMQFEIRWEKGGKTPAFNLEIGAYGDLDLNNHYHIPNGAECWIYAWQEGKGLAYQSDVIFKYGSTHSFLTKFVFKADRFNRNQQADDSRAA